MKKISRYIYLVLPIITFMLGSTAVARAQTQNTWSQCTDGRQISRCETYDCPKGDSNKDGKCTLTDEGARLTDARNDSFCANPISGCGQVHYYPSGSSTACNVRVAETDTNCNLYAVSEPTFTPKPTAKPTATASSVASTTTTKGGLDVDNQLPSTGPEHIWIGLAVLLMGAAGIYLYEKYKTV